MIMREREREIIREREREIILTQVKNTYWETLHDGAKRDLEIKGIRREPIMICRPTVIWNSTQGLFIQLDEGH